jgi:hypothetical protein
LKKKPAALSDEDIDATIEAAGNAQVQSSSTLSVAFVFMVDKMNFRW